MPVVKVTHPDITDEDAKKPPKRDPVPEGDYAAIIMKAPAGATKASEKSPTPLAKIAVEFQILYAIAKDGSTDDALKGRRVFQDFVLEPDETMPDLSKRRAYELVMLLDATSVAYTKTEFNSDHLISKSVKITVKHREGDKKDDEGDFPIFTNVTRIDTLASADSDDLV